jgi:hypothetical protein
MPVVAERTVDGTRTIVAFDGMHVDFKDLPLATEVTPAVDILFANMFAEK